MNTETDLDIAIVDDEASIRDSLADFLTRKGHHVRRYADGGAACAAFRKQAPDIVLMDIRMPGEDGLSILARLHDEQPELPLIMISGHADMDDTIDAMRHGAVDFLRKFIRLPELLASLERVRRLMTSEREQRRLRATLAREQGHSDTPFICESPSCEGIRRFLEVACDNPVDGILISGETGTGKDVLARELHRRVHGTDAPFIAVNCPALPDTLVESELFGHRKGAFTGADHDHAGALELADGGTLFLDELADLSLGAQAKLLRALETRRVRRLGSEQESAIDVTVIAASNQDLVGMADRGQFRRDLLYRLNTFELYLPPLRERCEDIPLLIQYFITRCTTRRHQGALHMAADAVAALQQYDFPGNIRELRNIIERAALFSVNDTIDVDSLHLPVNDHARTMPTQTPSENDEKNVTLQALHAHRWNRRETASHLGISYEALRWRIKKHGLSR